MKRTIQIVVSLIIGGVLVYFLFRNIAWDELFTALRTASIPWILAGIATVFVSFHLRILRWRYIVRATTNASFRHMYSATQIGFLANFTLPARAGEFIRPFVLSRLEPIPFPKALAMTSLDRMTDLFGLLAVMLIAGIAFQPTESVTIPEELLGRPFEFTPQFLRATAMSVLIVPMGVIFVFALLYVNTPLAIKISDAICGRISTRLAELSRGILENFSEGLHVFSAPGDMLKSIAWSLLTWLSFLGGTTSMMFAFGLEFPWYAPFVVQVTLAVSIALPGAPGFIGQFQAGMLAGLVLVLPDITYAQALAI